MNSPAFSYSIMILRCLRTLKNTQNSDFPHDVVALSNPLMSINQSYFIKIVEQSDSIFLVLYQESYTSYAIIMRIHCNAMFMQNMLFNVVC